MCSGKGKRQAVAAASDENRCLPSTSEARSFVQPDKAEGSAPTHNMSLLSALCRRSAAATPALRLGAVSAARTALPALSSVRCSSTVPTVTTSSGNVVPVDKYFDDESLVAHQARVRHADPANRTFNYTMLGGSRFLGASAARLLVVKFLASMNPAADVLALASLEVDISALEPGNCMIVKWRGKPVFVRARTGARPAAAAATRRRRRGSPPRRKLHALPSLACRLLRAPRAERRVCTPPPAPSARPQRRRLSRRSR